MISRWLVLLLVIFVLQAAVACGDGEDEPDVPDNRKQLRVLVVGNSFSWDAFVYVPQIVKKVSPDIKLTVGILYSGGCYLSKHYNYYMLEGNEYPQYAKSVDGGKWKVQKKSKISDAIADCHWDVVVMHQRSLYSYDYSSYKSLPMMVEWMKDAMSYTPDFAWMLTPAYPDGSAYYTPGYSYYSGFESSQEMFEHVAECARKVMEERNFDLLLPVGTAIENARLTDLNVYGDFKVSSRLGDGLGRLSCDGLHLQDGIGRLVANYAVAEALLRRYGTTNIMADDIWLSASFISDITSSSIMRQGAVDGMSEENRETAKRCAIDACDNPYLITK